MAVQTCTIPWREALFGAPDRPAEVKLGVDFVQASRATLTVALPGGLEPLRAQQVLDDGLGAVVWDCGRALARFVCTRAATDVKGRRVLDIGAGTGVAGLAAHRAGAAQVVLSDVPALLPVARANIAANVGPAAGAEAPPPVVAAPFRWGIDDATFAGQHDVVLAADCLYNERSSPLFCAMMAAICSPTTLVLMTYKKRLRDRERPFFELLERHFRIHVAPQEVLEESLQGRGVYVCCLQRRGADDGEEAAARALVRGLARVFAWLPAQDLAACSQVSRAWDQGVGEVLEVIAGAASTRSDGIDGGSGGARDLGAAAVGSGAGSGAGAGAAGGTDEAAAAASPTPPATAGHRHRPSSPQGVDGVRGGKMIAMMASRRREARLRVAAEAAAAATK